ncbi:hypothetical protein Salat_2875100 [Sesamum alatum]|uniref:RRM domain-containing protein n=1 Tax=Sesamum alatum TaxID=300844 RepID=A0AAE2CA60_9LAMI|nr:hypothetical protein Salat_2875100 [Sesamum alatum]
MNKLNADAQPFVPASQRARVRARASEEERSLFMTFSNGSPLTWQEIHQHFTSEYGNCVDYVYVHKRENRDPEFGRIIFTREDLPRIIMGDEEVVRILIGNKSMWLKKYVPQDRRNKESVDH